MLDQIQKLIDGMLTNGLGSISNRWDDEKEYEDIAEYQKVIEILVLKHGMDKRMEIADIKVSKANNTCLDISFLVEGSHLVLLHNTPTQIKVSISQIDPEGGKV
jgi:hypothetical protein